jgi:disulfide bond formation protein DsbB
MVTTRNLPGLIVGASVAALAGAFYSQYVWGLEPCLLCLYQRFPYGVTILLGIVALAGRWPLACIALAGAVLIGESGLAFFHVGVEQHWWAGLDACTQASATPDTTAELLTMLMDEPPPPCDQVPWSLFGISMAGYNVLYAAVLAVISLAGVADLARKART